MMREQIASKFERGFLYGSFAFLNSYLLKYLNDWSIFKIDRHGEIQTKLFKLNTFKSVVICLWNQQCEKSIWQKYIRSLSFSQEKTPIIVKICELFYSKDIAKLFNWTINNLHALYSFLELIPLQQLILVHWQFSQS